MAEDQEPALFTEGRPGRAVQPSEGVGVRAVIRRHSRDPPGRQPVVAWVDHGMIDQKVGPDEVRK